MSNKFIVDIIVKCCTKSNMDVKASFDLGGGEGAQNLGQMMI